MGTFRFKQFSVTDDNAAMKVGTDGVLLGAWCPVEKAKRILDIGTGSGVIALMLAQRCMSDALIDAVEVAETDARQAEKNVLASPWPGKVHVVRAAVQEYEPGLLYDLIVCNPPFFSKSLLPPDSRRTLARHDARLTHTELIAAASRLLHTNGTFCVILPAPEAAPFREACRDAGLFLSSHTHFLTRPAKSPGRELMAFGKNPSPQLVVDSLVLYDSDNQKSEPYKKLTEEFYL